MIIESNHKRIVVNPVEDDIKHMYRRKSWLMAARPGEIPLDEIPNDRPDPYILKEKISEFGVKINKWGLEMASLVFGVGTIAALAAIPGAMTVDTMGPNFEINHAPDIPTALTLGCLGLITAAISVFYHKQARGWNAIQIWMTKQRIPNVDVARTPNYTHNIRY